MIALFNNEVPESIKSFVIEFICALNGSKELKPPLDSMMFEFISSAVAEKVCVSTAFFFLEDLHKLDPDAFPIEECMNQHCKCHQIEIDDRIDLDDTGFNLTDKHITMLGIQNYDHCNDPSNIFSIQAKLFSESTSIHHRPTIIDIEFTGNEQRFLTWAMQVKLKYFERDHI